MAQQITRYEAEDGTIFTTLEQAVLHEQKLKFLHWFGWFLDDDCEMSQGDIAAIKQVLLTKPNKMLELATNAANYLTALGSCK